MFKLAAVVTVLIFFIVSALGIAATPNLSHRSIPPAVLAPHGVLPSIVHHTGQQAIDAYRAAQRSPTVLQAVPCTCGCMASLGHETNFDCYIDEIYAGGVVAYSTHGLNCTVCQVITRDAVAGAATGMTADALRTMILDHYGPRR